MYLFFVLNVVYAKKTMFKLWFYSFSRDVFKASNLTDMVPSVFTKDDRVLSGHPTKKGLTIGIILLHNSSLYGVCKHVQMMFCQCV